MDPGDLADALRAAGLTVKSLSAWDTRGGAWADGLPVGIMHHHTAPPVPFPPDRLIDSGQIKANINTKPDGTIYLIAYRACNYSSGTGSSTVLAGTKAGIPPTANATDRDDIKVDDTNGNPYYWNFENDHAGDGSAIPAVQLDAIVTASEVVADHFGLSAGNVVSHAEWTPRKTDPYWNGDRRCIEAIREGMDMPTADEIAAKTVQKLMAEPIWYTGPSSDPAATETLETIVSRNYRNVNEMIYAHRDDRLGADLRQVMSALEEIADAVGVTLTKVDSSKTPPPAEPSRDS
jgi:hypothetical protein